jgi:hypothetical protein
VQRNVISDYKDVVSDYIERFGNISNDMQTDTNAQFSNADTEAYIEGPEKPDSTTSAESPLQFVIDRQFSVLLDKLDEPDDSVEVGSLFSKQGITSLADGTVHAVVHHVFKACWLKGSGYGDFLDHEGDIEIKTGEWEPFSGTVAEDISKLNFMYSRRITYAHPRTTMLMFGPKNAPANQVQYMYVFGRGSGGISNEPDWQARLDGCKPRRGVVLAVTQFDGIPMADTFKVLTYFAFNESSESSPKTNVQIGLHVHFIKSTMLKSKISSGVKDELVDLAKHWIEFANARSCKLRRQSSVRLDPITGDIVEETPNPDSLGERTDTDGKSSRNSSARSVQFRDTSGKRILDRRVSGVLGTLNDIVVANTGIFLLLALVLVVFLQYQWFMSLTYQLDELKQALVQEVVHMGPESAEKTH